MTKQVVLELTDSLYERAQQLAQARHMNMTEVMNLAFDKGLPLIEEEQDVIDLTELDETISREIAAYHALQPQLWAQYPKQQSKEFEALDHEEEAYIRLHPQLKKSHFGRYVAIYQGKLIDDAADFGTLVERVRSHLPNEVIWMSQVENEPIPTIVMRSPQFIHE